MPSSFKMNNKDIQSEDAAEVFKDYFLNTAGNLQLNPNNIISPLRLLKNAYQTDFPSMKLIPVTKGKADPSGRVVCSRSPTGIAGLNPTGGMDVCLL
jgi:hypothetical protein